MYFPEIADEPRRSKRPISPPISPQVRTMGASRLQDCVVPSCRCSSLLPEHSLLLHEQGTKEPPGQPANRQTGTSAQTRKDGQELAAVGRHTQTINWPGSCRVTRGDSLEPTFPNPPSTNLPICLRQFCQFCHRHRAQSPGLGPGPAQARPRGPEGTCSCRQLV